MQQKKHEPLFEPIRMEAVEVDPIEQPAEVKVPVFSKGEVATLLAAYLFVFVGNGVITIPLLLAIPEVLINFGEAPIDILFPCLFGAAGVALSAYRFAAGRSAKQQAGVVNLGMVLMLTSLLFFWAESASGGMTFLSALPLVGLYLYFYNKAEK